MAEGTDGAEGAGGAVQDAGGAVQGAGILRGEASFQDLSIRQGAGMTSWLMLTYTKCKRLRIPIVEDNLPVYDFLNAIADIAPEFSSVWIVNVETMEADSQPLPDIF